MTLSISQSLQHKHLFITGATGFLGLALVEKILRQVPGCQLTLLVRSANHAEAHKRFLKMAGEDALFSALPFTELARVNCLAGDITAPGLGLTAQERAALQGKFQLVINSAASVNFDEPLDEAISINIEGPLAVQAFACEVGADLLQISTAYVCGARDGLIPDALQVTQQNRQGEPLDALSELQRLKTMVAELYAAHGKVVGAANNSKKLTLALMTVGREYANQQGWADIYTYTKNLAELLLVQHRQAQALGIFRPAIIESAAAGHKPGWLRGVKVMDMVLAAYGKGMIPGLPVDLEAPLDIIPVDMVANAVLAQAAEMLTERDPARVGVYQLGTSASNPLLLKKVSEYTYAHYRANPLLDGAGRPILVKKPKFPLFKHHVVYWLEQYLRFLDFQYAVLERRPLAAVSSALRRGVVGKQKKIKRYLALARMFGSYAQTTRQFETTRVDTLFLRLNQEEQALFNFEHHAIDWRSYMLDFHLPSLDRLLATGSGRPS